MFPKDVSSPPSIHIRASTSVCMVRAGVTCSLSSIGPLQLIAQLLLGGGLAPTIRDGRAGQFGIEGISIALQTRLHDLNIERNGQPLIYLLLMVVVGGQDSKEMGRWWIDTCVSSCGGRLASENRLDTRSDSMDYRNGSLAGTTSPSILITYFWGSAIHNR